MSSSARTRTTSPSTPADAAAPLRGVSPVLEVPFTAAGEVDDRGFERVVRHVSRSGISGVMFPGFASEFHKLSEQERWRLCGILLDVVKRHGDDDQTVVVILAVQEHATKLAVDHARRLVEMGADAINLLPPSFLNPSVAAVRAHVCAVLEAVAPTPVVLQHAPHQTGTSLDASTIGEIARTHPNLRLVKVESTPPGALIAALRALDPPLPSIVGYAGVQLPDAFRRGAVGVQTGCSFVEIYVEIWRRFESGDLDGALELHRRLLPYISYWMSGVELIVAAEKLISVRRGLFADAHCRAPAHHLDAEEVAMVDRFLAEFAEFLPVVQV
ncbi:dihydrodipicolinate synthase family protein [Thermasporomyces composti]|uniref:4-hydroxy-tetrahydrodipicolinate synthase n=1 Tax=Thermasporomyces composti TaxID=696763 RepID=A0A3D9V8D4_THECX|nr:dihydrodipicolinate synthase family protein [Thermasporomyces composti]REF38042.1 4-hydroxy-tetrahydrodipicolinate synthase [Thermasporomyces composti]